MKTINIITLLLGLALLLSCEDLATYEDCDAKADFEIDSTSDCVENCVVIFTNNSTGRISSVLWTFGDGTAGSDDGGNEITHEYTESGTYNVVLTVFSEGCPADEQTMEVTIGEPKPIPAFTVNMPRCTLVAQDCQFTFTDESVHANDREWFIDGVSHGHEPIFSKTFTEPDTVEVKLIATGLGGEDSTFQDIIIRPLTFPIQTYDMDANTTSDETVYIVDQAPTGNYYLIMNNGLETYLATADAFGTLTATPTGHAFPGAPYNSLQPQGYAKTSSGYLLVGRAVKPDLNIDMFVFKATTTLSFFDYRAYFRPFATDREEAFAAVENVNADGYLIAGSGAFDSGQKGMYFADVKLNLNVNSYVPQPQFGADGVAKAMIKSGDGYFVIGESNGDVVFFQLDDGLNPVGTPLEIQSNTFTVKALIPLSATSVVVLGNVSNEAYAIRVDVSAESMASEAWAEPFPGWLFRTGIQTSDGRLILAGRATAAGLSALFEINPETGVRMGDAITYNSPDIDEGDIYHLVETDDGGFILGGRGRKTGQTYQSILIKTDKNGDL